MIEFAKAVAAQRSWVGRSPLDTLMIAGRDAALAVGSILSFRVVAGRRHAGSAACAYGRMVWYTPRGLSDANVWPVEDEGPVRRT